jgi:hypothetical protein
MLKGSVYTRPSLNALRRKVLNVAQGYASCFNFTCGRATGKIASWRDWGGRVQAGLLSILEGY